ncbi:MAG: acyclic terpene utilization AtuA family protein [Pseudomonadota bacterium]
MKSAEVRIGCGAGFWGDSASGPRQLVDFGEIDYLVMDYLAEITMSILARVKTKDQNAGYATDFVTTVMKPLLKDLADKKIKVITNAGGINARACRDALQTLIEDANLDLKIAIVEGDDLLPALEDLRAHDVREIGTGAPLPESLASVNAYLGATPIAAALNLGADIVITGRCVDSALALGPLLHEFEWQIEDYDRLAAGSLVGHVIECGTQCTGGLFTDWKQVPGWDDMGFPIATCRADGSFTITKPPHTGGLITTQTIAEQVTYEIGDPTCYELPDVCCDFSDITLHQVADHEVEIRGAKGQAPSAQYKVSATYADGYRATATLMIGGIDATQKATRVAEAILARTRRLFDERELGDYSDVDIETLGAEASYGPHSRTASTREVILKIGVTHPHKAALNIFAREIYPSGTAMSPGITGFAGGRPSVQPTVRLFSCFVDKADVTVRVNAMGDTHTIAYAQGRRARPAEGSRSIPDVEDCAHENPVPLIKIAHGRSGDKGNSANVSLLARRQEFVGVLEHQVTEARVSAYFSHLVKGPVTRFAWPGLNGYNFVLEQALGGGGIASLRYDPQGKALAQMLLDLEVWVPAEWLDEGGIIGREQAQS